MRYLIATLVTALSLPATAALFCVTTSAELQTALATTGNNGEGDEIRVMFGQYQAPSAGFFVSLGDNQTLRISGGWQPAAFNNCATPNSSAIDTVLTGSGKGSVFTISPGMSADVHVSRLHFRSGVAETRGAGLSVFGASGYVGNATIQGNIFSENVSANLSAGLALACDGGDCTVSNNLFYANIATAYSAFEITGNAPGQTFVVNNTIVANRQVTAGSGAVILTGSGDKVIANNLFWENQGQDVALIPSGNAQYTFIANNFETFVPQTPDDGGGNLSIDPAFDLPASPALPIPQDFDLLASSPMNDLGYIPRNGTSWDVGFADVRGDERIRDQAVDIGAFEGPGYVFKEGFE